MGDYIWLRRILFVSVVLALPFFAVTLTSAAPLFCEFNLTCAGDAVDVFQVENTSGGFHNSHVELNNWSGHYNYSLCCVSDSSHVLNATCSNTSTSVIARLSNATNAHIQIPSVGNYEYDICLGATFGDLTCTYENTSTCASGTSLFSMSGTVLNYTNAHVHNSSQYELKVCCDLGKSPPTTPVLLYPVNGNETVFERMVNLNWSPSEEPDGDIVEYNVSLNVSSGPCSVEHTLETEISDSNFTTTELCVDQYYNWSVQACDVDGCSLWANVWNFTIQSTLGIRFLQNTTTFATLTPGGTNDTEAGPGFPMRVENNGNIVENVDLNASNSLFLEVPLNRSNFVYKVAENESSSFITGSSQMEYTNVTTTMTRAFTNLSYVDAGDDGLIHYRVTVPLSEAPGTKTTNITVRVTAS